MIKKKLCVPTLPKIFRSVTRNPLFNLALPSNSSVYPPRPIFMLVHIFCENASFKSNVHTNRDNDDCHAKCPLRFYMDISPSHIKQNWRPSLFSISILCRDQAGTRKNTFISTLDTIFQRCIRTFKLEKVSRNVCRNIWYSNGIVIAARNI